MEKYDKFSENEISEHEDILQETFSSILSNG